MRLAASLLILATLTPAAFRPTGGDAAPAAECGGPTYYSIDLVTTKRVPGSRSASGTVNVLFASSPFGVSVTGDGSYAYDLVGRIDGLGPARSGRYVAWVTTPDLSEVRRLGELDDSHRIEGRVSWNKFLVVVSLEAGPPGERWSGPIVLRGMSRSGRMHTMAGHGPFQAEPCASFGYR